MDAPISHPRITIRKCTESDATNLFSLIDALADYEHLERPDAAAHKRILQDAFGKKSRIEVFFAEVEGMAVAYSIVFETYSSFLALPTLYLEDIFVLPDYRKRKIGLTLFLAMADIARDRGCGRMEWSVLNWNHLAIDFYKNLGAEKLSDWCVFRLTREQLASLHRILPHK